MSLHIYTELEQGSQSWLDARCGMLTASQLGKLLTPKMQVADNETSRGLIETLVAERLTGVVDYIHPTFDMQRGTLDESYARDFYAEQYDTIVDQIGFAVRDINGHQLGASPDGVIDPNGGIEIKSRRPKAQVHAFKADIIPPENLAQIHCNLLVLDREWWDYVSYAGNFPLYVKRVYRSQEWDDLLTAALDQFEANADRMIGVYRAATDGMPVAPFIDHFADIEIEIA